VWILIFFAGIFRLRQAVAVAVSTIASQLIRAFEVVSMIAASLYVLELKMSVAIAMCANDEML
jgi:hypothetical protein